MSNHCHLIIKAKNGSLSDIIRDIKKFTAKSIYRAIENNPRESRKKWLLLTLKYQDRIWFWEEGYHGVEITTEQFYQSKVNYIHQNPVKAGIVAQEQDYLLSSASEFCGVERIPPLELTAF